MKSTKETLLELRKYLLQMKKKAIRQPCCNQHYIDLDYREWNDPVDGLDYAIHLINKRLKNATKRKNTH